MKLSNWAKKQGICYDTAWRWFHAGILPAKAIQLPSGTIMVTEEEQPNVVQAKENAVIYCRVSSNNKKDDLERQIQRCSEFACSQGLAINKIYKEVASGMNDNRRELNKMLDANPTNIVVEHKDRLTRFGFNYIEKLLLKQNCKIIVINRDIECENDLMKDLISIITSFCCRLYGLRRGKNKAKDIKNLFNDKNL